jgi:hypothetical protein
LLKKWGEGVSLIRGPWKARDEQESKDVNADGSGDSGNDDDHLNEMDSGDDREKDPDKLPEVTDDGQDGKGSANEDILMDGLTKTMGSLNLVPPSIRFGRGGKNGGFASNGRAGGGHLRGRGRGRASRGAFSEAGRGVPHSPTVMEIDAPTTQPSVGSAAGLRGLGWAGRSRAGIVHVPRGHRGRGSGMGGPA